MRLRHQPEIFENGIVKVESFDAVQVQKRQHRSQTKRWQGQWKLLEKKLREKNLGSRTPFSIWKSSIAFRGSVQLVSASLKKVSGGVSS